MRRQLPVLYPAGYAIDTVIPIINVHQAAYWGPNRSRPMGWTWLQAPGSLPASAGRCATLLVAGYTGLARQQ